MTRSSTPHPAPDALSPSDASGEPHTEAGAGDGAGAPALERLRAYLRYVIQERDDTFALMLSRAETSEAQLALARECIANLEDDQARHEAQLAAMTAERDALVGAVIERAAIKPAKSFSEYVAEAAVAWCGEKDRETFPEDITYFTHNWSSFPGFWPYVIRAALTHPAPVADAELEAHPDDLAVDRFAAAMKAKLKWEREERGRHGWNNPEICSTDYLADLLIDHLAKGNAGNFEDVANFCMMLHQRGDDPAILATALRARTAQPVGVRVKPLDPAEVAQWFDGIANHTSAQSPRHMAMNFRDRILSALLPEGGA